MRNPEVAARIKELQRQNALAAQVTVASVTEMYMEVYRGAMAAKEYPPAATAVTGIAKLHGLVIDRQQIEAALDRIRRLRQSVIGGDDLLDGAFRHAKFIDHVRACPKDGFEVRVPARDLGEDADEATGEVVVAQEVLQFALGPCDTAAAWAATALTGFASSSTSSAVMIFQTLSLSAAFSLLAFRHAT